LEDFQLMRQREPLYRAGRRPQAASRGAVGLRQHEANLVARLEQRGERAFGEFRSTRED
jgi:hypothetical protein